MKTRAKATRKLSLLLAMSLAAVLAALPAQAAATFTVNSTNDTPDANPGDGACSTAAADCTLRAAIQEANALDGDDVIGFDPSVGGTITLGGSHLLIGSNLKIEGPGADKLSVDANSQSQVFNVQGGTVEISGLTVTGGFSDAYPSCSDDYKHGGGVFNRGTLTLSNSTISQNTSGCGGGGVHNTDGTLTVSDTTITNNTATNAAYGGGGIYNRGGDVTVERSTISGNTNTGGGGGISSGSFSGSTGSPSLTIADSTITGNTAGRDGGGLSNITGPLTVSDSTISDNTAARGGGGIYNIGATMALSSSTVTANETGTDGGGVHNDRGDARVSDTEIGANTAARNGGGIYTGNQATGGTLAVERSTISGNTATNSGGGIYADTWDYLQGLIKNSTVTNTTISANTATDGYGGGLYNFTGITEIGHSTITDNTAPTGNGSGVASLGDAEYARTDVYSSIVSGNENTDVDFIEHPDWGEDFAFANTFASGGHNVVGDGNATSAFDKNGDRTGVSDPRLGPLQDNGGPTDAHALLAGSPAIDAVPVGTNGCATDFTADQRGVQRPLGGACDAGSVENFGFGGFYSPVDNPDVLNRAKAGSSIPVKFSLGGDMGLGIFATGTDANNNAFTYPTSSAMRCDSTDGLDAIEETVAAGGGGLSYVPNLDRYTYVWKTQKAWAGTCRQLVVKLEDGTYHRANFKFVR